MRYKCLIGFSLASALGDYCLSKSQGLFLKLGYSSINLHSHGTVLQ